MWTPTPPLRSRHLLKHAIIGPDALQNAEKKWIWKHMRNPHCTLHFDYDVVDDLEWVGRTSDPLLLNNNLLVYRSGNCVLKNGSRADHKRMGYTVEPFHVPLWMNPLLALRDRLTPLLLGKDMNIKLQEGRNHLRWLSHRKRSRNGLNIAVLPHNPFRQVMHHPGFASHGPSGVPTYVLKRRQVSSALVLPPDDMTMLHLIHPKSVVSSIRKSPGRFPSTDIRVLTIVIFKRLPQNELLKVSQNPSLQTQRDKFISAHKHHTNDYTFTIH